MRELFTVVLHIHFGLAGEAHSCVFFTAWSWTSTHAGTRSTEVRHTLTSFASEALGVVHLTTHCRFILLFRASRCMRVLFTVILNIHFSLAGKALSSLFFTAWSWTSPM